MSEQCDLEKRRCKPCEGGVEPMKSDRGAALLEQIPGWALTDDSRGLRRRFEFRNFHRTMAFINAMAWIAHVEDHHPDFSAGYNYCEVRFTTHAIGGLSENDFICAAKISALLED